MVLVGCGESQQSASTPEAKPEPPTAKALDTSIHDAAAEGNIEVVKQYLAAGTDVNAKDKGFFGKDFTPLHNAAQGGHKEVAELLINKGADVNAKDRDGGSPLHHAALEGHREVVELLIANGADVNELTGSKASESFAPSIVDAISGQGQGETPLDKVLSSPLHSLHREPTASQAIADLLREHGGKTAEELMVDEVKKALSNGVDINAKIDGLHPLTFAVTLGNEEIVKLLIKEGGDVNGKDDDDGTTPLHSAANRGLKEIIELLIKKGANINTKNKHGETPLDSAINYTGHVSQLIADQIIDLLVKHGGKYETMHSAAAKGDLDELSDFLDSGLDVNAKNKNGETALHNVSSIEMAKLLIDKGANVNARDYSGITPLHCSVFWRPNKKIAELLIAEGANVKARYSQLTTLHLAVQKGHLEIVELLIAKGADVNAKGFTGRTPLDSAFINKETAALLRKHGGKTGEELKVEGK